MTSADVLNAARRVVQARAMRAFAATFDRAIDEGRLVEGERGVACARG